MPTQKDTGRRGAVETAKMSPAHATYAGGGKSTGAGSTCGAGLGTNWRKLMLVGKAGPHKEGHCCFITIDDCNDRTDLYSC